MAKLRISLTPALKRLEIVSRRLVTSALVGSYMSVFKGQGLEFEEYKNYTPADDAKFIDWKATLRANDIMVKKFGEERELQVFLLVDVSSTMFFGSVPKLKNEYAAELAASLCYAILKADDAVGFALFSDRIVQKSLPVRDTKQFYVLLKNIVNINNYGGPCNFKNAIEFAIAHLKENSILIIISDFVELGKDWRKMFKIAAGKFDLIGVMVRDPRDKTLPPVKKMVLFEDLSSGRQLLIQPEKIREKYSRYVKMEEKMIEDLFKQSGSGFISLSTDKDFSRPIINYFNRRLKQFV